MSYVNLFGEAVEPPTIGPLERLHQLDPEHPDVQPSAYRYIGWYGSVCPCCDHDTEEDFDITVSGELDDDQVAFVLSREKNANVEDGDDIYIRRVIETRPWEPQPDSIIQV